MKQLFEKAIINGERIIYYNEQKYSIELYLTGCKYILERW